jgi:hypothetical protein
MAVQEESSISSKTSKRKSNSIRGLRRLTCLSVQLISSNKYAVIRTIVGPQQEEVGGNALIRVQQHQISDSQCRGRDLFVDRFIVER